MNHEEPSEFSKELMDHFETTAAEVIARYNDGGVWETLYKEKSNEFFLLIQDETGTKSAKYSKEEALLWLEERSFTNKEAYREKIQKHFYNKAISDTKHMGQIKKPAELNEYTVRSLEKFKGIIDGETTALWVASDKNNQLYLSEEWPLLVGEGENLKIEWSASKWQRISNERYSQISDEMTSRGRDFFNQPERAFEFEKDMEPLLKEMRSEFPEAYIESHPASGFPGKAIELNYQNTSLHLVVDTTGQNGVRFHCRHIHTHVVEHVTQAENSQIAKRAIILAQWYTRNQNIETNHSVVGYQERLSNSKTTNTKQSHMGELVDIQKLEKELKITTSPEEDFDIFKLYIVEKANGIEKGHEEAQFNRYHKKMTSPTMKEMMSNYFKEAQNERSFFGGKTKAVDRLTEYLSNGYKQVTMETWGKGLDAQKREDLEKFTGRIQSDQSIKLYRLEAESLLKGTYLITSELKQERISFLKNVVNERNESILKQAKRINDLENAYQRLQTAYNVLVNNVKKAFGVSDEKMNELRGLKGKEQEQGQTKEAGMRM